MTQIQFHTMNKPLLRVAAILAFASLLLAACLPTQDTSTPTQPPAAASAYPPAGVVPTIVVNTVVSAYPPAVPVATPVPNSTSSSDTNPYPPAGSSPSATQGVAVNIGQSAALGSFLVDSAGMTLYAYSKDTTGTSTCSAGCLANWQPLLATGAVTAGTGLDPTLFGTAQTTDGYAMVTYKGAPLYHFKTDVKPGDTNGNGVGGVWSVVKP
jgi:predicted lipoprotein with Yx(FWY)xxD motif